MRAAVSERAGSPLKCVSVPDPTRRPGDLILEVAQSGVCGTDLHLTQSGLGFAMPD